MRLAGNVAHIGRKINACNILVKKSEGERPLGRPRCRLVDNIKIYLMMWYGSG
jgi:hypothetical protein